MVMISLTKMILPIQCCKILVKKEFVLSTGIQQFCLKHQTVLIIWDKTSSIRYIPQS